MAFGLTNCGPHNCVFADGRIKDPSRELLGEVFRRFESAPERSDILAVDEDARIVRQRARLRLANGFEISDAHPVVLCDFRMHFHEMFGGQRAPIFLIRIGR